MPESLPNPATWSRVVEFAKNSDARNVVVRSQPERVSEGPRSR
ncbi:hypothetical protein RISK_005232 [Rhodopirellula islandica]|uniref:Uncharacterized protein n=1 Tax=Rhodopirellula islandica TaxID=595434 RepID=A0A0J1B911_RHOIS|nr:hypothetical protein RISK_005232 [Rhodopirellula islandica]